MKNGRRVATWLELAVAPEWKKQRSTVRMHPVQGDQTGCFALSMDGRLLCASNGQLTVFKGVGAALHFLKAVRVEGFEPGEPLSDAEVCDGSHYCLGLDSQDRLSVCRRPCQSRRLAA